MNDILEKIVRQRLEDFANKKSMKTELESRLRDRNDFRPFHESLRQKASQNGTAAIIAETKRGSPSLGLLRPDLDPAKTAREDERGGAACLSVLTEPRFFHGKMEDLIVARKHCKLPVLQKDFIVTELQVLEAALHADAMLLIARCLERSQLADLAGLAETYRLDVLLEVFDEADLEKIDGLNVPLIGINHRDLATMEVDLEHSRFLIDHFQAGQTIVAASGIRSRNDIERLMTLGIRSFLVGETLSRSKDRAETLQQLVLEAGHEH